MRRIFERARRGAMIAIGLGALLGATASPAIAHDVRIDHSGAVFEIFEHHSKLRGCRPQGWQQLDWAEVVYRNGFLKGYYAAPNGGSCLLHRLDNVGPVRWRACSDPGYECTGWETV